MIAINKIVFTVVVAESQLPYSEAAIAEIKEEILERARRVWGPDQMVQLEAQWQPAPGFYSEPVQLAVFTMYKVDKPATDEDIIDAEVVR